VWTTSTPFHLLPSSPPSVSFLTITACNDWGTDTFNFNGAYLNSKLDKDEEIYMKLPPAMTVRGSKSNTFTNHSTASSRPGTSGTTHFAVPWLTLVFMAMKPIQASFPPTRAMALLSLPFILMTALSLGACPSSFL
jgi:hypothetical protein